MSNLMLHLLEEPIELCAALVRKAHDMVEYLHAHFVDQNYQLPLDQHHEPPHHSSHFLHLSFCLLMPQGFFALNLSGVKSTKFVDRTVETFAVDIEELHVNFELAFRPHRVANVNVVFDRHEGRLALHCRLPGV